MMNIENVSSADDVRKFVQDSSDTCRSDSNSRRVEGALDLSHALLARRSTPYENQIRILRRKLSDTEKEVQQLKHSSNRLGQGVCVNETNYWKGEAARRREEATRYRDEASRSLMIGEEMKQLVMAKDKEIAAMAVKVEFMATEKKEARRELRRLVKEVEGLKSRSAAEASRAFKAQQVTDDLKQVEIASAFERCVGPVENIVSL